MPAARSSCSPRARAWWAADAGQDVFLTLPGGARAQPLLPGTLASQMAQLPAWRAIAGISDGLLPDNEHRVVDRPPPSLEECLLAVWPGPFGWLLLAEPLSAAGIQEIADELAQREQFSTGNSDRFPERAMAARRLNLRHAEMRKGASTGLWRVRLLAGGTDAEAASRVAGLVCASADLVGLPYAVAPANGAARALREILEDPARPRLAATRCPASRFTRAPSCSPPFPGRPSARCPESGWRCGRISTSPRNRRLAVRRSPSGRSWTEAAGQRARWRCRSTR